MRPTLRGSTVGIVGLGLMGGSLARELAASGVRVLGYDADAGAMAEAADAGVLAGALEWRGAGFGELDLLVLAVPVDRAAEVIDGVLPHLRPDCVVTDLGSTKLSIQEAAERSGIAPRFVGSHPLTGGHRSGWGASHRDLYAWQRVFLCPTAATRTEALIRVRTLWEAVGALPEIIDPAEHDRRTAWTSHLPQLTSTALALALDRAGLPRRELGPGGRDATRLAASSPEMWSAICLDNAERIAPALEAMERQLHALRGAVERRDAAELHRLLAEARAWAEQQQQQPS